MRKSFFRFKKFACSHGAGSMKIGVDAVLIGAWADVSGARRIIDVGTGCGVIALMCAQRNQASDILAIDVDDSSVMEARENFSRSPWSGGLEARREDFNHISLKDVDLIISNHPYFNSGISSPDTPRLMARHQSDLSPHVLLTKGKDMLSEKGRISMIIPAERMEEVLDTAHSSCLHMVRALYVKGHPKAPVKRILMEFGNSEEDIEIEDIPVMVLETADGQPTPGHHQLCKDFYLKF